MAPTERTVITCPDSAAGEADDSIGADQVDGALHDQAVGVVELRDVLAAIDQEGKREVEFAAEVLVLARCKSYRASYVDEIGRI